MAEPLLSVVDVRKEFDLKAGRLVAVDGVSFEVADGETLGLVGESGCGKSTLARVIVGLLRASGGRVELGGRRVERPGGPRAGAMQMVFQDPASSLNPRQRVWASVVEPLRALRRGSAGRGRAVEMLARVGLGPEIASRYPGQLSGGQQQRVGIARALIANPELVVFDEAISSLDVSLQAQVVALVQDLQAQLGATYVFITHDLARAMEVSDRIAIMYLGKLVELVPADRFEQPLHPYAQALVAATLVVDPGVERTRAHVVPKGDVPSAMELPSGCRFHTRCPFAQELCAATEPPLVEHEPGHWAACHFARELRQAGHLLEEVPG